ncbi:MAG: RNA polymerase sigma factor [Acidobacteriaceae bacterium]
MGTIASTLWPTPAAIPVSRPARKPVRRVQPVRQAVGQVEEKAGLPAAQMRQVHGQQQDTQQRVGERALDRHSESGRDDGRETERLVRQCMAGDAEAWQLLVVSYHRRVYAICYRFTGSATDAEDLTQEVFLKVYRNLNSFDLEKGSFQTWITTLARNLLVDHFRRSRQERVTDSMDANWQGDDDGPTMADRLADSRPTQHDHIAQLELKARVQAALKQLSPELREAVILRDLEDLDYKEIAQVLRIPEGTVKSRISRGRGELARILERTQRQVM